MGGVDLREFLHYFLPKKEIKNYDRKIANFLLYVTAAIIESSLISETDLKNEFKKHMCLRLSLSTEQDFWCSEIYIRLCSCVLFFNTLF
jgi:hypothetical protein